MFEFLIYVSHSRQPTRAHIEGILDVSRKNNAARDITGALCHVGENFIQYLEGEGEELDEIFGKIEQDSRHSKVRLLLRKPTPQRLYPSWTMALVPMDERTRSAIENVIGQGELLDDLQGHQAERLMFALAASGNWRRLDA